MSPSPMRSSISCWTSLGGRAARRTANRHFVVVRDREKLRKIAGLRPNINWLAAAPVGIAIVLDGSNPLSEAYDEGRVTERLLTGATLLGYGGRVPRFSGPP